MEQLALDTRCQGLRIMALLATIATAERLVRSGMPQDAKVPLYHSTLADLGRLLSDRRHLAEAAAEAEHRQQAAGFAGHLSAADLQRLTLLLDHRLARGFSQLLNCVAPQPGVDAAQLLQRALGDIDQLIALEGGGPTPARYLRWRGTNLTDLAQGVPGGPQHRLAAAAFQDALAACETNRGERRGQWLRVAVGGLLPLCCLRPCLAPFPAMADPAPSHEFLPADSLAEANACLLLARELMLGSVGQRWSLARVRGLLARARSALAQCKPWLPTAFRQLVKSSIAEVLAQAEAIAAANPGAGDSLPAAASIEVTRGHTRVVPTCDACGKQSLCVMQCAACRSAAYW